MSATLKPFQTATVDAACSTLQRADGARRFLVADEVGLGKTVVAREVVRRLAQERRRTLVVFYVANGQRVASQNRGRLIDFLPPDLRGRALSRADRVGLIPMTERPAAPVALYALTPETSFPSQASRLSEGRKEERAYIAALFSRAYPRLVRRLPRGLLQARVKSGWTTLVDQQRRAMASAPGSLIRAFRKALRAEFGGDPRSSVQTAAKKQSARTIVGRLRRALAHAALLFKPPDLVIFDEFQRYRHLLSTRGREDRLIETLLSNGAERRSPAILMLSATPYRLFASRWEESRGIEAHRELFDLIEFLGGDAGTVIRERAAAAFTAFGAHLRTIASAGGSADGLAEVVAAAKDCRRTLQDLLAPLMSRTERETGSANDASRTVPLKAELAPGDVHTYRHLVTWFQTRHRSEALAYWLSVPLPAQALGNRYQAWKQAKKKRQRRDGKLVKLTVRDRSRLTPPADWPHPKLRALRHVTPSESLALPWTAPSLPWWPLAGPWANGTPTTKLLLFSRFRATPQSVAALTSFGVEAAYLGRDPAGYDRVWRRRRLQPGLGRLPVLALFHPSPFLIQAVDPLQCAARTLRGIRGGVRRQLVRSLSELGVEVRTSTAKERERRQPTWSLIAALDQKAGFSALSGGAWGAVGAQDRRLSELLARWHAARRIEWISPRELEDLSEAALSSPGVVAGRALVRHCDQALEPRSYGDLVRLTWGGLRLYLDNPVFWARLKGSSPIEVIQRAVAEGGLESLLDEHFWILKQASAQGGADIATELQSTLNVITGSFSFHPVGPNADERIRIRCHTAVPFGGTDEELEALDGSEAVKPARSDELRKAFNAPFWPHVLATTSVGQEGLDFHTWCARVAHWDLCSSPLDLEQREGRIQRFGGLLVRRRLAEEIGPALLAKPPLAFHSIWDEIAVRADETHGDASGLSPWWLLPDTGVTRYVFELPQGRDTERFARLREQRFIYRLALGQPNQEDLVDVLSRTSPNRLAILKPLALNLSAFSRQAVLADTSPEVFAASLPSLAAE